MSAQLHSRTLWKRSVGAIIAVLSIPALSSSRAASMTGLRIPELPSISSLYTNFRSNASIRSFSAAALTPGGLAYCASAEEAKELVGTSSAAGTATIKKEVSQKSEKNKEITAATFSNALKNNSLLKQEELPRFDEIQASEVLPAIEHSIEQVRTGFKALEDSLRLSVLHTYPDGVTEVERGPNAKSMYISDYALTIEKLEALTAPLEYAWGVVGHLLSVNNSEELRAAHDSAQPKVVELFQAIGQSKVFYESLQGLKKDPKKLENLLANAAFS